MDLNSVILLLAPIIVSPWILPWSTEFTSAYIEMPNNLPNLIW